MFSRLPIVRLLTGAAAGFLCALLLAGCGRESGLPDAPAVQLQTLSGDTIELQSLQKPVLVNFWSPSCVSCLHEMPDLAALYADYAADGFELIAVAMPSDPPDQVLETAREREFPFPVAIDLGGKVLAEFSSVKGTPTSFLFAADGTGVARYVGPVDIPALRRQLDALLYPAATASL